MCWPMSLSHAQYLPPQAPEAQALIWERGRLHTFRSATRVTSHHGHPQVLGMDPWYSEQKQAMHAACQAARRTGMGTSSTGGSWRCV